MTLLLPYCVIFISLPYILRFFLPSNLVNSLTSCGILLHACVHIPYRNNFLAFGNFADSLVLHFQFIHDGHFPHWFGLYDIDEDS